MTKYESKHAAILQQKVQPSCVDCYSLYHIIQEVTQQTIFYQHSTE